MRASMLVAVLLGSWLAAAGAAVLGAADKQTLDNANKLVQSSDVCKNDEWSYLCNKDAWAGAADAVTGGIELQTAALRRALDHTIKHTDCDPGDTACESAKDIVDAQLLDIPKVINSDRLAQVHSGAGLIHPAAQHMRLERLTAAIGVAADDSADATLVDHATKWADGGFVEDDEIVFHKVATTQTFGAIVEGKRYYLKRKDDGKFNAALQKQGTALNFAKKVEAGEVTVSKVSRHATAAYRGDTIGVATNIVSGSSDFIDDQVLVKWVDADETIKSGWNGCDDADGNANGKVELLAGSKDVRATAHVLLSSIAIEETCSGGTAPPNDIQAQDVDMAKIYYLCRSLRGQGRKACQAAGCTYQAPKGVSVGFAYTRLTDTGVATDYLTTPDAATWRLCMTSPSISNNMVFADTMLTVAAACPDKHEWNGHNCVCEAGRTRIDHGGVLDPTITAQAAKIFANVDNTYTDKCLDEHQETTDKAVPCNSCMACPAGMTSTPTTDNNHVCERCPIGQFAGVDKKTYAAADYADFWKEADADTRKERVDAGKGHCTKCPKGRFGLEHMDDGTTANANDGIVFGKTELADEGKAKDSACGKCPKGTYQPSEGAKDDHACIGCGAGEFVLFTAAAEASEKILTCTTMCANAPGTTDPTFAMFGTETLGLNLPDADHDYTTASFPDHLRYDHMDRCVKKCTDDDGVALNGVTPIQDTITKSCLATCDYDDKCVDITRPLKGEKPRVCAHRGLQEGYAKSTTAKTVATSIAAVDTIEITGHGFNDGQKLFYFPGLSAEARIDELKTGVVYTVSDKQTNSIKLKDADGNIVCIAKQSATGAIFDKVDVARQCVSKTCGPNERANFKQQFTCTTCDAGFGRWRLTSAAVADNKIEFGQNHNLQNDDPVQYRSNGKTAISGLVEGQTYYVKDKTDKKIKLADRPTYAAGTQADVAITGGGAGNQITRGGEGDFVYARTGAGSVLTVTAISAADPTVVTAAHSLENGDIVSFFDIVGAVKSEVDNVECIVADATATTFKCTGLAVTKAFTSGKARVVHVATGAFNLVNNAEKKQMLNAPGPVTRWESKNSQGTAVTNQIYYDAWITAADFIKNNGADPKTNTQIEINGHPFLSGDRVRYEPGPALPITKLTAGQSYYVHTVDGNKFSLSLVSKAMGGVEIEGLRDSEGSTATPGGKAGTAFFFDGNVKSVRSFDVASQCSVSQCQSGQFVKDHMCHKCDAGKVSKCVAKLLGKSVTGQQFTWRPASITAITQSSTPLISAVNDYANGDVVVFANVAGMVELEGQECTVANVCAGSFSCADLDTSDYGKFVADGNAETRFETLADAKIDADVATERKKYLGTRVTAVELKDGGATEFTSTAHPWADDNFVRLQGFAGVHEANDFVCKVKKIDADKFKCVQADTPFPGSTASEPFRDDGKAMAIPLVRSQAQLNALQDKVDLKGAALDPRDNSCDHSGMDNKAATDPKNFYKEHAKCYDVLCPANYYTDNNDGDNGCTSCPAYTTRKEGDKAAATTIMPFNYGKGDASQFCSHIQCPANWYRTASAGCAKCAAGKFTDGGDDGVYESSAQVCAAKSCPFAQFGVSPFTSECMACPGWLKPKEGSKTKESTQADAQESIITFAADHGFTTGQTVLYRQGDAKEAITNLEEGKEYIVLKDAATKLRVAPAGTAGKRVKFVKIGGSSVVVTVDAHGFSTGDIVSFSKGNLDMAATKIGAKLTSASGTVTVLTDKTFSVNIDTTGTTWEHGSNDQGTGVVEPSYCDVFLTSTRIVVGNIITADVTKDNTFTAMQLTDATVTDARDTWAGCADAQLFCDAGQYLKVDRSCGTCPTGKAVFKASTAAIAANKITANNHGFLNKDLVVYTQGVAAAGIPELKDGSTYKVVEKDDNTFKLAPPDDTALASVAKSSTVKVTTTAAHAFVEGISVKFSGVQSLPSVNGKDCVVSFAGLTDAELTARLNFFCSNMADPTVSTTTTGTNGKVVYGDTALTITEPATNVPDPYRGHHFKPRISRSAQKYTVFTDADVADNKITAATHGFTAGDTVKYHQGVGLEIFGLASGTSYYVRDVETNKFKVAARKVAVDSVTKTNPVLITAAAHGFKKGDTAKLFSGDASWNAAAAGEDCTVEDETANTFTCKGIDFSAKTVANLKTMKGGYLLSAALAIGDATPRAEFQISGITKANGPVVTARNSFDVGDIVEFHQVSTMLGINKQSCKVAAATPQQFTCTSTGATGTGDGLDTSTFTAYELPEGQTTNGIVVVKPGTGTALSGDGHHDQLKGGKGNYFSIEADACKDWECGCDQSVTGGKCVNCAVGTFRPAGDKSTSADTTCAAKSCPVGQRVKGNRCIACPVGKTSAADPLASADKACPTVLTCSSGAPSGGGPGVAKTYGKVDDGECAVCTAGTAQVKDKAGYERWMATVSTRSNWKYNQITFIEKKDGAKFTSGTTDLSNGDFVVIQGVAGMIEVNNKLCKVKSRSSSDFVCEKATADGGNADTGDTSTHTDYSSGGYVLKGAITHIEKNKDVAEIVVNNNFAEGDIVTLKGLAKNGGAHTLDGKKCRVSFGGIETNKAKRFLCLNLASGTDDLTFDTIGYAVKGSPDDDGDTTAEQGLDAGVANKECENVACKANQYSDGSKCQWCANGFKSTVGNAKPPATISWITNEDVAKFTATGHTFETGDLLQIKGVVGMKEVNYVSPQVITGIDKKAATEVKTKLVGDKPVQGSLVTITGASGIPLMADTTDGRKNQLCYVSAAEDSKVTCGGDGGNIKGIDSSAFTGQWTSGGQITGRVCEVNTKGTDSKTIKDMVNDGGKAKITLDTGHGFLDKEVLRITDVTGLEAINGALCTVEGKTDTSISCTGLDITKFPGTYTANAKNIFGDTVTSGGKVERDYFTCKTGSDVWNSAKGNPGTTPGTPDQAYKTYTSGGTATVIGKAGVGGLTNTFDRTKLGNEADGLTSGNGQGQQMAETVCEPEAACTAGTNWNVASITAMKVSGDEIEITAVNVFTNGMHVKLTGFATKLTELNDKLCKVKGASSTSFKCENLNCKAAADAPKTAAQPLGGLACSVATDLTKTTLADLGVTFTTAGPIATAGVAHGGNEAQFGLTWPAWTTAIGGQYVDEQVLVAGDDKADYSEADSDGKKRWQSAAASQKVRVCRACPVGKRNPNANQRYAATLDPAATAAAQCTEVLHCPKNHYIDASHACVACPSNTFRPAKVAAAGDSSWPVVNGFSVVHDNYKSDGDGTSNAWVGLPASLATAANFCKGECAVNEHVVLLDGDDKINAIKGGTYACQKCPKGKNRVAGDKLVRAGVVLPAGADLPVKATYAAPMVTACSTIYCPDDTFTDGIGGCCACEPGKTNTAAARHMTATDWETKQDATQTKGDCVDTICAKDFYNTGASPPTGDTPYSCKKCPAGKTNPQGDNAADKDAGTCSTPACGIINGIYHRYDTGTCVPCEYWQTSVQATAVTAATADAVCVDLKCPEDHYVADDKWHQCKPCAAGFTAKAGSSRAFPTHCEIGYCKAGEFVNNDKNCEKCPVGTTSRAGIPRTDAAKALSTDVCTNTDQDFVYADLCKKDEHVKDHVCVKCPAGKTNDAGDDPNLNVDTFCDAVPAAALVKHSACGENERVEDHRCIKCPVGTTNQAGDDPHYFDTACTPEICHENHHVVCTGAKTDVKRQCTCKPCPKVPVTHEGNTHQGVDLTNNGPGPNAKPNALLADGSIAGSLDGIHLTNTAGDDCSLNEDTYCV